MNIQDTLRRRVAAMPGPKRGDALFEGTDYPREWKDFIGQDEAKHFLMASIASARIRKTRLDHTLIATGAHGVGKSALARLVAKELDVGMVEVQGVLEVTDALRIFSAMKDGDILFWDEIHLAISRGKSKAEWLLPLLQDGVIVTPQGVTVVPDITVIGATTDVQKLPETIISRFVIKPVLDSYTAEQADAIVQVSARSLFGACDLPLPNGYTREVIATAANRNPRAIMQLLKILRDSALSGNASYGESGTYSTDAVFRWSGLTPDGLDRLAQEYLMVLYMQPGFKAGEKTIAQALGEPTPPRHTEKLLIQKGLIRVCSSGRELTGDGSDRTGELIEELGLV